MTYEELMQMYPAAGMGAVPYLDGGQYLAAGPAQPTYLEGRDQWHQQAELDWANKMNNFYQEFGPSAYPYAAIEQVSPPDLTPWLGAEATPPPVGGGGLLANVPAPVFAQPEQQQPQAPTAPPVPMTYRGPGSYNELAMLMARPQNRVANNETVNLTSPQQGAPMNARYAQWLTGLLG